MNFQSFQRKNSKGQKILREDFTLSVMSWVASLLMLVSWSLLMHHVCYYGMGWEVILLLHDLLGWTTGFSSEALPLPRNRMLIGLIILWYSEIKKKSIGVWTSGLKICSIQWLEDPNLTLFSSSSSSADPSECFICRDVQLKASDPLRNFCDCKTLLAHHSCVSTWIQKVGNNISSSSFSYL